MRYRVYKFGTWSNVHLVWCHLRPLPAHTYTHTQTDRHIKTHQILILIHPYNANKQTNIRNEITLKSNSWRFARSARENFVCQRQKVNKYEMKWKMQVQKGESNCNEKNVCSKMAQNYIRTAREEHTQKPTEGVTAKMRQEFRNEKSSCERNQQTKHGICLKT